MNWSLCCRVAQREFYGATRHPLRDVAGQLRGGVGAFQDITLSKQRNEAAARERRTLPQSIRRRTARPGARRKGLRLPEDQQCALPNGGVLGSGTPQTDFRGHYAPG